MDENETVKANTNNAKDEILAKADVLENKLDTLTDVNVKNKRNSNLILAILVVCAIGVGSIVYNIFVQVPTIRKEQVSNSRYLVECTTPINKDTGKPNKCFADLRDINHNGIDDGKEFLDDLKASIQNK